MFFKIGDVVQSFQFPLNILFSPSKLVTLIIISSRSIPVLMLCCVQISCCLFGKLNVPKTHTPVLYCFLNFAQAHFYTVFMTVCLIWFCRLFTEWREHSSWAKISFIRRCFYQGQVGVSCLGWLCIAHSFSEVSWKMSFLRSSLSLRNVFQLFNHSQINVVKSLQLLGTSCQSVPHICHVNNGHFSLVD